MTQNVMEAGKPRRMFAGGYETVRGILFRSHAVNCGPCP